MPQVAARRAGAGGLRNRAALPPRAPVTPAGVLRTCASRWRQLRELDTRRCPCRAKKQAARERARSAALAPQHAPPLGANLTGASAHQAVSPSGLSRLVIIVSFQQQGEGVHAGTSGPETCRPQRRVAAGGVGGHGHATASDTALREPDLDLPLLHTELWAASGSDGAWLSQQRDPRGRPPRWGAPASRRPIRPCAPHPWAWSPCASDNSLPPAHRQPPGC